MLIVVAGASERQHRFVTGRTHSQFNSYIMFPKKKPSYMFLAGLMMLEGYVAFTPSSRLHKRQGLVVDGIHGQLHFPFITTCLSEGNNENIQKPKELTPDNVAEMVEVSFVNACIQLAQGYVDVLKLFIVAVKAAYELNMAPDEVTQRVDSVPRKSAGRDLMPEEIKLRNTWIHCIFLVLESLKHKKSKSGDSETETATIDDYVQTTYSPDLLVDIEDRHDNGETFQLDALLKKHSFPNMDDPTEKLILSQSLRAIWFTYTVLKEEKICLEEKSGLKAQPPIPGAYE